MFVVSSYPLAVVLCAVTMLCWGSWANTQKAAGSQWRFELYYWDYVFGVVVLATISAFTLGSFGSAGRGFLDDAGQAHFEYILSALVGGVVFNLANILLVAAIAIAGMSVAFPVGIGLALVVGVGVNYVMEPTGNPVMLVAGVALVAAAIVLDAIAYRRLSGQSKGVSTKGLILSLACGLLMGTFYLLVARTLSPNEDPTVLDGGYLSPYTAVYFFALGILASNLIFNRAIMAKPPVGEPVSWADYRKGTLAAARPGRRRRHDLVRGHDAEHHRRRPGRTGHLLRPRPGRHAGRRHLGRLRLEGIPRRPAGHQPPAGADVPLVRRRAGPDRRREDRVDKTRQGERT